MLESNISFMRSPVPLDDETVAAAEQVIAHDGLGITKLEVKNGVTIHVEYPQTSSPRDIVRTLGFLAEGGLERPIHFIRVDGTEHSLQLD